MRRIFLKKHEERRIRAGHLWVFSNEVDTKRSPLNDCQPGEAISLHDAGGAFLGAGYVNPASLISVRLLTRDPSEDIGPDLVRRRLMRALEWREHLFAEPFYRLCHSEGDFLPGLVVDRFGDVLSLQLNTAGMEALRGTVLEVLDDVLHPRVVVLRNDTASRSLEGLLQQVESVRGSFPDEIEVVENKISFIAPFAPGKGSQKTGWFFDQRPNRLAAAAWGGKTILDAFSYVGGFGCVAGRAGAARVTFLDASENALTYAVRNLASATPETLAEAIHGDALDELARLRDAGRRFDLVCLDPPAFIKRKKDAAAGLAAYRRVNDLGLQLVANGGILLTCSCSHHLEADELHGAVTRSLAKRGLRGQLIRRGFQGQDHPVHPAMPETAYLKCLAFRVWK